MTRPIDSVVIVGGGTAGWMTAAALVRLLPATVSVTLVESDAIGTVGVGEATIPPIHTFHRMLGLDEDAFLRATGGTAKLGIEFVDWRRRGERYFHPFGSYGVDMAGVSFPCHWLRVDRAAGATPLERFSLAAMAARKGRFMRPIDNGDSPLSRISYAFHFDAGRYARHLRSFAEERGAKRREGRVVRVERHGASGLIEAVVLDEGARIGGDLFIDCSGFSALLIEQALEAGFVDWSHWLPCDRAVAVASEAEEQWRPMTRATARPAGWQWRIPLQHRVGNGHVYAGGQMSDDEAAALLLAGLDTPAVGDPRLLRFRTGRRRRFWIGNCVAIGLSAGFLEPLESTSIWLIQAGLARLMAMFPDTGFGPATAARYNRLMTAEFEQVRDFLILHYHATERADTPFWDHVRTMTIPDRLQEKMACYAEHGRACSDPDELFSETSWFAVLHGQAPDPAGSDPLAEALPLDVAQRRLGSIERTVATSLAHMPAHRDFLARHHALAP